MVFIRVRKKKKNVLNYHKTRGKKDEKEVRGKKDEKVVREKKKEKPSHLTLAFSLLFHFSSLHSL